MIRDLHHIMDDFHYLAAAEATTSSDLINGVLDDHLTQNRDRVQSARDRTVNINFEVTAEEREHLRTYAKQQGLTMRQVILDGINLITDPHNRKVAA